MVWAPVAMRDLKGTDMLVSESYLLMGILGAMSYPDLKTDNVLNVMAAGSGQIVTKVRASGPWW